MSEELENSVREMLKEETWTRAGIANFTITNLNDLAEILKQAHNQNCENTIKDICDQQLLDRKDSISALYLSGMIALKTGSIDTSPLVILIEIFEKNHKEQLVESLCLSILAEDAQNKFALKKLAEYYKNTNDDRVWDFYETIVKVDMDDAEVPKILAERYEAQTNEKVAINYYKKAILRYIPLKNYNAVKEVWAKLKNLTPDDIDFFLLVQRKVAKSISPEKSALLLQDLYPHYKDIGKWDTAIELLKMMLEIDNHDQNARKELVECYRGKYADHKQLEEYIRSSNLNSSFRNVFESINDFEKHIAFDANSYVYHRTWGVGKIKKVEGDLLTIIFVGNGTKKMSLKMAVSALQPLDKHHIWVLKAVVSKDKLTEKVKKDITWTLKTVIKSFNNNCDEKTIKNELVPSILTQGEWTSWHSKAQKELAGNPIFGVNPNDVNLYTVREHEMQLEERLSNEFKAEKDFFARIDVLMRYLNEGADITNELFLDMYNYFAAYVKAFQSVTKETVASYLVVQEVLKKSSSFENPTKYNFEQIYGEIENPSEMYTSLKDTKNTNLRESFIRNVRNIANWEDNYIKLFPTVLDKKLLDELAAAGFSSKLVKLVQDSFSDYRAYRNSAIFLFEKCSQEEWFKEANISFEKQLVTLVNIISQCYKEINNHVNTVENKKTIKNATALLFARKLKSDDSKSKETENTMLDFMLKNDEDTITRMYTIVNDVKDLESNYKLQLRSGILSKYPNFKFQEAEIKSDAPKGTLITAKKLEEKKAEAENIEKVELPKIAEEIAEAKQKGDLKENAEYIAAREAQSRMNQTLGKLKSDLASYVIFDPTTVTTSMVSFGTVVTLHDNINNQEKVLTILGPAESNAEKGILSYLSPLAHNILDMKVGESKKFTVNKINHDYTVKSIVAAKI